MKSSQRIRLVADFNAEPLARLLRHSDERPTCDVEVPPFGELMSVLTDTAPSEAWTLIWTRPEFVLPGFRRALELEDLPHDDVMDEAQRFAEIVAAHSERVPCALFASWALPIGMRGYGLLDYRPDLGLAHLVARLNLLIAARLAAVPNVYILDSEQWLRASGGRSAAKLWFAGKVPFPTAVIEQAAHDVKAALAALAGTSRKLLVVDLDETLWGGIVGEVKQSELLIGGHSIAGEAYVAFQRSVKALTRRGIQLGIVSKNTEAVALDALDMHPEMVLRRQDFAGWRINWADKAQNIVELANELKLGLDSVVFIDDNPAERTRVREALPEVLVPEWPNDPSAFVDALNSLRCFDTAAVTTEDRSRTVLYVAERERKSSLLQEGTLEDWRARLDLRVHVESLGENNLPRVAQLLNKTNQMNLTTRRLSASELRDWSAAPGRMLYAVRVSDRFGDAGLTGMVSLQFEPGVARLIDFVLSCRVLGRCVEETMLYVAITAARQRGAQMLCADYVETARNVPCFEFLRRSGMEQSGRRFSWPAAREYQLPRFVALTAPELAGVVD